MIEFSKASRIYGITWSEAERTRPGLVRAIHERARAVPETHLGVGTAWCSEKDFCDWSEAEAGELTGFVMDAMIDVVTACDDRADLRWARLVGWANVQIERQEIGLHDHHQAVWSAVYYVELEEERAGFIRFPKAQLMIQPAPGMLLVFPGNLEHHVEPNRGLRPRISVAFNAHEVVGR